MSEEFNNQKAILSVFLLWIDKRKYLSNEEKRKWFEIGMMYRSNLSFLYSIYNKTKENGKRLTDEQTGLSYINNQEGCEITYGDMVFHLTEEVLRDLIGGTICLLEEIYPLGSVVELKMKYKNPNTEEEESLPMVITHRFVSPNGEEDYFEYAGVPYPTGLLEADHLLFFTQESIENVLQKGFEDSRDQIFSCTMKQKLVVEGKRKSIAFSKNKYKYQKFQNKGEDSIEQRVHS